MQTPALAKSYARIAGSLSLPALIEVQLESYRWFQKEGLKELFDEVSPIVSYTGMLRLHFPSTKPESAQFDLGYRFGEPTYTQEECLERDVTYAAPLNVDVVLENRETGEIIRSEIFLGDFPLMTENGTFIINGTERVVVSQLIRSPGVYFENESKEPAVFRALLVPYRGPWIDFSIDGSKVLGITISKRRKIPITRLLRAFGHKTSGEILKILFPPSKKKLSELVPDEFVAVDDIVDPKTGELLVESTGKLTDEVIENLKSHGIEEVEVYDTRDPRVEVLLTTLRQDRIKDEKGALGNIYRTLRYTPPKDEKEAREYIHNFFFSRARFYLARVGRYKLNWRLGLNIDPEVHTLTMDDFLA